jgi:GT2 family glycosyltransferase
LKPEVDVLIPTYARPAALAVTLAGLAAQSFKSFRLIISDQNETEDEIYQLEEIRAMMHILRAHGHPVEVHKHLPRRGLAEQRQFLLLQSRATYCLYLDDDVFLEPYALELMLRVIKEEKCGFAGSAVIGLSYLEDFRPHEQDCELWEGPVQPEVVTPETPAWQRYRLHNAANLYHVQKQMGATPDNPLRYKVAWIGGCVVYDTQKLREVGGFDFWRELPKEHSGEDVFVQLRLQKRSGGCGIMPSGAYHLELPTTIPNREFDAPKVLKLDEVQPWQ